MSAVTGHIHSLESFGAVDGPGIRYVVFFQGCPLRCIYCHNPDSWEFSQGIKMTVDEVADKIISLRPFYRKGGVTLSGGEPLAQSEFATQLLRRLKDEGFHTAIDTAGSIPLEKCREAVDLADLLLLDIKALDPALCSNITGADGSGAKALLEYRQSQNRPVWIRHVLVPGYTLVLEHLEALAHYLSPFTCIERVELLPFHQLGSHKWELLGLDYTLKNTIPPSSVQAEQARSVFRKRGFSVY
ncbi:MAG: pyruvate formate lyase-activating protein [Oscillospiraceae bacterium]|nr:pyruvate formate lyase-activating protein [Oscillospiraceae bacterium]